METRAKEYQRDRKRLANWSIKHKTGRENFARMMYWRAFFRGQPLALSLSRSLEVA